jgi:L-ascorbate metabolism protein UlaG (beta-lactamase superfamily)
MLYIIIIVCLIVIITVAFFIAYVLSAKPALPLRHLLSTKAQSIQPENWKGTPIDQKGRFVNYANPFYQNYVDILKWLPFHCLNLIRNLNKRFESVMHSDDSFLQEKDILIWLGHASFYLNLNGLRILVDPHFHNTFPYIRHTPVPISADLFNKIDILLITHDHSDHCDKRSLKRLFKNNPKIHILTGSNMEGLIQSFSEVPLKITTALWHEQYELDHMPEIHFIPTRHYSKRLFNKFNKRLWGGFIIKYRTSIGLEQTILLGGDSGYGEHYGEIGNLHNPDIAILGIGAYMPLWFMNPNHMSPVESIKAFDETGASKMVPMHYGTFNLSNEYMEAPTVILQEKSENRKIILLTPGQIFSLN